jgi:tetratricopeptide (TPR) repeat protein
LDLHNLNRGVIEEHIAEFRRSIRADQFNPDARYGLGVAYFNLGLLEYASDELQHAARLMPENPNIHAQLAVVLRDLIRQGELGQDRALQNAINHSLKVDPANAEALAVKAERFADTQHFDEANHTLELLSKTQPEKSRQIRERILVARIVEKLEADDWDSASELLDDLAEANEQQAVSILQAYIDDFELEFPLDMVDAVKFQKWHESKTKVKFACGERGCSWDYGHHHGLGSRSEDPVSLSWYFSAWP